MLNEYKRYTLPMKNPNKQELQQAAINHCLNIEFKGFMRLYEKCTTKPYSFLANEYKRSDNPLHFRRNFLERI